MPHYEKVTLLKVKFSNLYLMGRLISGHTKEGVKGTYKQIHSEYLE